MKYLILTVFSIAISTGFSVTAKAEEAYACYHYNKTDTKVSVWGVAVDTDGNPIRGIASAEVCIIADLVGVKTEIRCSSVSLNTSGQFKAQFSFHDESGLNYEFGSVPDAVLALNTTLKIKSIQFPGTVDATWPATVSSVSYFCDSNDVMYRSTSSRICRNINMTKHANLKFTLPSEVLKVIQRL